MQLAFVNYQPQIVVSGFERFYFLTACVRLQVAVEHCDIVVLFGHVHFVQFASLWLTAVIDSVICPVVDLIVVSVVADPVTFDPAVVSAVAAVVPAVAAVEQG